MKALAFGVMMYLSLASVQARQIITIVYPFPNESITNIYRLMAAEANRVQDKYTFVVDIKPGAGGSIAANHVLNTPNTVLAHTTAFFVRPNVFPRESYDITHFRSQYVLCQAPMAVTSSKYRSWSEVPRRGAVTIGTSGLGVTSHLVSLVLAETVTNLEIVPFKSTTEAMASMMGGFIDLHIGFISEIEQWRNPTGTADRKINILGITGPRTVAQNQPLANQGFSNMLSNMTLIVHVVIPAKLPAAQRREFYEIFDQAAQSNSVKTAMSNDYCATQRVKIESLDQFFETQVDTWRRLSSQVRLP